MSTGLVPSATSGLTAAPASPADAGAHPTPGACEAPGLSSRPSRRTGFNPRWIVGKTVAAVEMHPSTGHGLGIGTLNEPVIRFTDGSAIVLYAVEGEDMDGVDIIYTPKVRS